MKNFADYSVDDFATEPLFIQWVQQPSDAELSNFWLVWLDKNPHKVQEVEEAKKLVSNISSTYSNLDEGDVNFLWHHILDSLDMSVPTVATVSTIPFIRWLLVLIFSLLGVSYVIWRFF